MSSQDESDYEYEETAWSRARASFVSTLRNRQSMACPWHARQSRRWISWIFPVQRELSYGGWEGTQIDTQHGYLERKRPQPRVQLAFPFDDAIRCLLGFKSSLRKRPGTNKQLLDDFCDAV